MSKFTKADLKNYMRVTTRNGDFHIYLEDLSILIDADGCSLSIAEYDNDLICMDNDEEWDVVKIGEVYDEDDSINFEADTETLWERYEPESTFALPSSAKDTTFVIDGENYVLTKVP